MKRKLFTLVLAASMAIGGFTSCSKNADKPATNNGGGNNNGGDNNGGGTLKEKLVGSYKMTELTLEAGGKTHDVLEEEFDSCDKDNLYVLKADMTTQTIDAGEQCSPPSDDTGTWSLEDDNTITVDGTTYNIESISGKTVKMSVEFEQDGAEAMLNVTWVKQ